MKKFIIQKCNKWHIHINSKKNSKSKLICVLFLLPLVFAFTGCYFDMEYSPYMVKPDKKNLNAKNIAKIKKIEEIRSAKDSFKIGLISDTHHYFSETEDVISKFNKRQDLDFVVVIGDITNQGLLKEYEWTYDVLNELKVPFVVVIGNHDCLNYGIEIYKEMFGKLNFTFSFKGVEFICFENNSWESEAPDYKWLEKTAAKSKYRHLVHFSHIPNHNKAAGRFSTAEVNLFNNIMGNYFDIAIHGHGHFDSDYKLVTGVPRHTIGSVGYDHYMILKFENNEFVVERF